ncbi:MAG: YkgJ family cysteine cluster protein [Thermodesulfovibrionales bacterium]|jgi:uncharacterized cysteine cluster protein YcgN (CxxCxxCC family)
MMSRSEWEDLCDRCGICCLVKIEDEDDGTVYYTNIICRNYDIEQRCCSCYETRAEKHPDCIVLNQNNFNGFDWLPKSCAYRKALLPTAELSGQTAVNVVDLIGKLNLVAEKENMNFVEHIIELPGVT